MNTEIRRVAAMLLVGFFVLTGGLVWWQVVRADRLAERAGNPRVVENATRADRGTIYASDGSVLARSERGADGRNERVYPVPSLAQTIGYVSARFGVSGVEEALNGYLSGTESTSPLGVVWNDLSRDPPDGNDVYLTIDPAVQKAAAEALGDRRGAVVALDPRTGAVRAIVSAPGYDPARIDEDGDALLKDQGQPLLNRATQGQYPPGSTFKTVTAVAAIDSGAYPANAKFSCPVGKGYVVGGFVIVCKGVPETVRGDYDFARAYAYSINANFAEIAVNTGATTMTSVARALGFEERIPFDIPLTVSRLLRPGRSFDDVLLANTGFGQGELAVTPMQMAMVAAAVANNGVLMNPYLVEWVQSREGAVLQQQTPRAIRQAMKPETAATLRQFMQTAVRDGFSQAAAIPGVDVGGKSGTAEIGPNVPTHAWFTSVAPLNDPSIVVAVIVENGGQGASVAAPIAQQVMRAALRK
ncbi:MAG: hypothetical protein HYX51_08240 [Chloroflexi bacterium]|nr:hypothetical protein [Chloroflexota bacterium]